MTTTYTVPDSPADPAAAALELIVRFPEQFLHTDVFRSVLQDYARPGQHVHSKAVSDIIGDVMRRVGVPGTPHALRHYFGSSLVAAGTDLRTAQTLLRHTTAIYVQVADVKRVEAIDRLDPFG